jgi:hypothetical protein
MTAALISVDPTQTAESMDSTSIWSVLIVVGGLVLAALFSPSSAGAVGVLYAEPAGSTRTTATRRSTTISMGRIRTTSTGTIRMRPEVRTALLGWLIQGFWTPVATRPPLPAIARMPNGSTKKISGMVRLLATRWATSPAAYPRFSRPFPAVWRPTPKREPVRPICEFKTQGT